MNSNMPKISGPFGNYERGTPGSILNALHAIGVPINQIEDVTIGADKIMLGEEAFANYRFFDGIDLPLFRFYKIPQLNEQHIVVDKDGILQPQFRLVLTNHDTPGLIFNGEVATVKLHEFLKGTLTTYTTDSWYKVHKDAGAFFQGGINEPNGKWFYIEFWKPSGAQAYVDKLNTEYKP